MKDDTISRQAVLNLIEQSCCDLEYACDNVALRKEVEALPPAQPERKKGRWLNIDESEKWECSECGRMMWFSPRLSVKPSDYSFCPNCGADMRGEQDG